MELINKLRKEESIKAFRFDVLCFVLKLIKDSRWRKKCKKLIKRLRNQLVVQKNRREAIIRQSQADISQLQNIGSHENALARAKQLQKDQCVLYAYQQIDNFCDCIYLNLPIKQSKMTAEILEAASSLVFAASRCGEFSELSRIRKLMGRRFGSEFERVNVELLPGNCVNSELRYNLGNNSMLKEENPQISNKIDAELHKIFSGEICDQEKGDNFNRKIENKEKLYESKIKNMINRIGSKRFPSFNSTHSATIHVDIDSSSSIEDMEREDEESKARSSYVHPKLPNYDDLVVTFTEYKKERLMKSDSNNKSFRKWMRW